MGVTEYLNSGGTIEIVQRDRRTYEAVDHQDLGSIWEPVDPLKRSRECSLRAVLAGASHFRDFQCDSKRGRWGAILTSSPLF